MEVDKITSKYDIEKDYLDTIEQIQRLKEEKEIVIKPIIEKLRVIENEFSFLCKPYDDKITDLEYKKQGIIEHFKNLYEGQSTIVMDKLKLSFRITKSLTISNITKVVEILQKTGKLEEGIKSFNKVYLRKLYDVGMLESDSISFKDKVNVTVKKK